MRLHLPPTKCASTKEIRTISSRPDPHLACREQDPPFSSTLHGSHSLALPRLSFRSVAMAHVTSAWSRPVAWHHHHQYHHHQQQYHLNQASRFYHVKSVQNQYQFSPDYSRHYVRRQPSQSHRRQRNICPDHRKMRGQQAMSSQPREPRDRPTPSVNIGWNETDEEAEARPVNQESSAWYTWTQDYYASGPKSGRQRHQPFCHTQYSENTHHNHPRPSRRRLSGSPPADEAILCVERSFHADSGFRQSEDRVHVRKQPSGRVRWGGSGRDHCERRHHPVPDDLREKGETLEEDCDVEWSGPMIPAYRSREHYSHQHAHINRNRRYLSSPLKSHPSFQPNHSHQPHYQQHGRGRRQNQTACGADTQNRNEGTISIYRPRYPGWRADPQSSVDVQTPSVSVSHLSATTGHISSSRSRSTSPQSRLPKSPRRLSSDTSGSPRRTSASPNHCPSRQDKPTRPWPNRRSLQACYQLATERAASLDAGKDEALEYGLLASDNRPQTNQVSYNIMLK
ncbi:unnamed protein product [Protopolystoma xenopodis]|uniref:Uncharacterized protein n=1 Tax=Protopolystoma xenopodis TaxID=117903 RepID=A0A3S5C431_9PLAT|nr:unnamed protein product [Protopolystoma xenopodis]